MNGYLYRVKINSDFYACFVYSDDSAELKVEEELPTANTINDLIKCDDHLLAILMMVLFLAGTLTKK